MPKARIGRKALEIVAGLDDDPEIAWDTLKAVNRAYEAYRGDRHLFRKIAVGIACALSAVGVWEMWEASHTEKLVGFENATMEKARISHLGCQHAWTPFRAPNCT